MIWDNQSSTNNKTTMPYQCYNTMTSCEQPDILLHWHPEIEIHYIREGFATFRIDYETFDNQKGDIVLIKPNSVHSIHRYKQHNCVMTTFSFHSGIVGCFPINFINLKHLQPFQTNFYTFTPRITSSMEGYDDIKECLFAIFKISKHQEEHFEWLLKSKLNELIYILFKHHYISPKNSHISYYKDSQIRNVIDYINTNYHKELPIDVLANFMGYSKTHFMTIFKQHVGISCTEFIIQVRLKKACELLANSSHTILNIAFTVGFRNLSHFNRQFKQYYNMTPRQYRKKFQKGILSMTQKDGTEFIKKH